MVTKTITATEERKLISLKVEDGVIICTGRSIIDINGKKIRGQAEEIEISGWPVTVDGKKWTRKEVIDLLTAIYDGEIDA